MEGLLAWYDANGRDLPWRGGDAYAVWVSEVMLQQTRVDAVIPYFERFMARFPDVLTLADADEEEVRALWSGLGYYRRAAHLHAAAKRIVAQGFPKDETGWRAIAGIGPYTAAALASILHGAPSAALDGNLRRVLGRVLGERRLDDEGLRRIAAFANEAIDPRRPGDWNQALMDLGSTLCTPRSPRCDACPLVCRARGDPMAYARRNPAKKKRQEKHHALLVRHGAAVLLVRAPAGLLGGMWLPMMVPSAKDATAMARDLAGAAPVRVGRVKHLFTHRSWDVTVHVVEAATPPPPSSSMESRLVGPDELHLLGVPSLTRRVLAVASG